MTVDQLMFVDGATIYYDDGFRIVLEDHMTYLRTHPNTTTLAIDQGRAYKYEYDLFGFLTEYAVPVQLHWVVMRMNSMTNPMQFTISQPSLLIPDTSVVEKIRQSHMTSRKVV